MHQMNRRKSKFPSQQTKPTSYEKQRDLWYKKLKDEGFDDIEVNYKNAAGLRDLPEAFRKTGRPTPKRVGSSVSSKVGADSYAFGYNAMKRESTLAYYNMATAFLNDYAFATEKDRIIWEYHSNGLEIREISKLLTAAGMKSVTRNPVWQTIKRLEKEMKRIYLRV